MYLLPEPKKIIDKKEKCFLPYNGIITIMPSCTDKVYGFARILKEDIADNLGFSYTLTRNGEESTISLSQGGALEGEHYIIEIDEGKIRIKGGDERGILYGIQTLRQLLRLEGACIPCLLIEDYPSLLNRGFFHDITRGRVPTLQWLKTLADILSFYKMNQMQLYIEHSFLFPELSEMWRDDTPLNADEIMALDAYCMERGIELIPSLSTFGHLYKLLNTKKYRHLCELTQAGEEPFSFIDRMAHHTIDVSNEESLLLVKRMIAEFMSLFSSKKFNICADETFDLGKGRNRERAKEEGGATLYMDYVGELCEFLVENGRIPMLWGDVMLSFPEFGRKLPEGTVCLNWGYAYNQSEDSTRIYAENGVRQYVCPGVAGWNQLVNLQRNSYENISRMCGYATKYKAEGMLNTDWGDFGHINHPAFSIPGIIYGAVASWNGSIPPYKEINRNISLLEYKEFSGKLLDLVGEMSEQESFGWGDLIYWKEKGGGQGTEQRDKFLAETSERVMKAPEKNREIDRCVQQLTACMKSMDSSTRKRIYPYLVAAEGMKLFNRIGMIVVQAERGYFVEEIFQTAEELEKWYYQYRLLWYTVSRESELYRIGEVIFWYSDYLRDLKRY
ncbi:MAG: family 20 glycosylhydrolase [Clostridiales bacterium]|nr:family 20 glycosylhydrolase [Clostridiales bacterium]